MTADTRLHGLHVLVTRPAGQADRLCHLIESAGGTAVRLPAIEILGPRNRQHLEKLVDRLPAFDLAVFVSVNAVTHGMDWILAHRAWPAGVKLATVGARSAQALERYGLQVDLVPEHQFNSEALVALDELQDMTGKHVVIFRGNGGRDFLYTTLSERGAEVEYVEVYRRECPRLKPEAMAHLWKPGALDIITVTSNETLQNLFDMAGQLGQVRLCEMPLLVISRRQAELAARLGFKQVPVVADNASDEAIVAALVGMVGAD